MGFALLIIIATLLYTNFLVRKIANDEREKIRFWADAIQRKASLVKYTEGLFEKLKTEERKKVEIWAKATKKLISADISEDLTFYSEIISQNNNIPVILTDNNNKIKETKNVDFSKDTVIYLNGRLLKEYTIYKPIIVSYGNQINYLYYKNSKLFNELKSIMDDLIKSFISEVAENSASVPVIMTDSNKTKIFAFGNIDSLKMIQKPFVDSTIAEMSTENPPISIDLHYFGKSYIFYKNSFLLTQMKYFPFVQFAIIGIFIIVSYFIFSTTRKNEQNQVWVGMAKETAHQLGTPLSSMMAWLEILKMKHIDEDIASEIEKDLHRLETITQRFSNIGSLPRLQPENILKITEDAIEYMKLRTSYKILFVNKFPEKDEIIVPLNVNLFEWVIENLCKNSVDAISGPGMIECEITEDEKSVYIDITDTGRGITKSKFRTIFKPGYTSKQRGWGLGLTLAERIIVNYHSGKLYVKQSIVNKGTTFRIILNKI